MGASEKAVAAAEKAAREHRLVGTSMYDTACACGGWPILNGPTSHAEHVARVAADAAVDTDRPSIQAQALREAAKVIRARKTAGNADIGPNGRSLERRAIANALSVEAWAITDAADRTEAQP